MNRMVLNSSDSFLYSKLKSVADDMRKNPTEAESILWMALNKNQLGTKFRRQHVVDRFIVDFYSVQFQLAIEVDGSIHVNQKEQDQERDARLNSFGITVVRFENNEVINHLETVIYTIKSHITIIDRNRVRKSPL